MSAPLTPHDVLASARTRVTDPAAWHHAADDCASVTAEGHEANPQGPEAARWDLYGAMVAACSGDEALDRACALLAHAVGLPIDEATLARGISCEQMAGLFSWIEREHQHVEQLAALDRALDLAARRALAPVAEEEAAPCPV